MSRLLLYFASLVFILSCSPKNSNIDFEQAKEEILQLHHAQRKYHFEKDSVAFAQQLSDQHISVNRGKISSPTHAEHIQRFHRYFESVDFEKWDDVIAPVIRFSEDGKMAYTIVEKEVAVNYEEDGESLESTTNFAWVAIYKKYENGWKIDCVASTNQPTIVEESQNDIILNEKDLIPEGTAFNEKNKTLYIGSIYRQKIIGIDSKGKVQDIIAPKYFGELSPIGMEMEESTNTLWVNVAAAPIVNQANVEEWQTGISAFDMDGKQLKKYYPLNAEKPVFLNDLTVTADGTVFATESVGGDIYKIDSKNNELQHYLKLEGYSFPNGITYYSPINCLFVATNEGVLKLNLESKEVELLEVTEGINAKVIDGLALYENYLIGHQSSKISKFYLDDDFSKIIKAEIFDRGEGFDSSTTGEIGEDFYYYIVNSQIRSGINQVEKTIKPIDSLEQTIIRKKRL